MRNEQLEEISGMAWLYVNQETRQIEVWHRLHNVHRLKRIYEYHDGEFVLVTTEEHYGYNGHWEVTYADILTGEITVEIVPFYDE